MWINFVFPHSIYFIYYRHFHLIFSLVVVCCCFALFNKHVCGMSMVKKLIVCGSIYKITKKNRRIIDPGRFSGGVSLYFIIIIQHQISFLLLLLRCRISHAMVFIFSDLFVFHSFSFLCLCRNKRFLTNCKDAKDKTLLLL